VGASKGGKKGQRDQKDPWLMNKKFVGTCKKPGGGTKMGKTNKLFGNAWKERRPKKKPKRKNYCNWKKSLREEVRGPRVTRSEKGGKRQWT